MPLLDSNDHDAIRLKMGFPDGAMKFLPDGKIEKLRAVEAAIEWVAAQTEGTGAHAQEAARAYAAYKLLPQCRGELQAAFNAVGGSQAASADGWYRHTQMLLDEAQREIDAITEVTAPEVSRPQGTTTAGITVRF
jgi:hypothetical protein